MAGTASGVAKVQDNHKTFVTRKQRNQQRLLGHAGKTGTKLKWLPLAND